MNNEKKQCDSTDICAALDAQLEGDNAARDEQGFHLEESYIPQTDTFEFVGIKYVKNWDEKNSFLNFCPYCGGRPGVVANREQEAK